MPPTNSLRPAGPALTPSATSMTVLSDSSLSNPYVPSTFTDGLPLPRIIVFDLDYTLWPFWCDTHITPPVKPIKDNSASKKASEQNAKGQTSFIANKMADRWGEHFGFYSEVPAVLSAAKDRGIVLGIASRTHTPDLARDLLRGLNVPVYPTPDSSSSNNPPDSNNSSSSSPKIQIHRAIDLFPPPFLQMYPGTKTTHFRAIHTATTPTKLQKSPIPALSSSSSPSSSTPSSATDTLPVPYSDMLFFDDEARNRNVETDLGVTFWLVRDGVSKDEVDKGIREWRRRNGHHQ